MAEIVYLAGPTGEARVVVEPWTLTSEGVALVRVERWLASARRWEPVRGWVALDLVPWWAFWRRRRLLHRVLRRAAKLAEAEALLAVRRRGAIALAAGRDPDIWDGPSSRPVARRAAEP